MKDPWFKFHTSDWRGDVKLRACSLSARGLWIELMALAHEAEPYGHVLVAGEVPTVRELAKLVGATPAAVAAGLKELAANDVVALGGNGGMYSRRMVRDHARKLQNRINAKRGGNPKLMQSANDNKKSDNRADIPSENTSDISRTQNTESQKESKEVVVSARDPEAEPVSKLDAERMAATAHPATAFIRRFDEIRGEIFGEEQARPWPRQTDFASACRWMDAGADLPLVESVLRVGMNAACARMRPPPQSLAWFDKPIADAIAVRNAPMPTGDPRNGKSDLMNAVDRRIAKLEAGGGDE